QHGSGNVLHSNFVRYPSKLVSNPRVRNSYILNAAATEGVIQLPNSLLLRLVRSLDCLDSRFPGFNLRCGFATCGSTNLLRKVDKRLGVLLLARHDVIPYTLNPSQALLGLPVSRSAGDAR